MDRLKSMTGFGLGELFLESVHLRVQIRSWNRKGSDLRICLPPGQLQFEGSLREWLHPKIGRGVHQIDADWKATSGQKIFFDRKLWEESIALAEEASLVTGIDSKALFLAMAPSWCNRISSSKEDLDLIEKGLLFALEKAFSQWELFKTEEGAALTLVLESLLEEISQKLLALQATLLSLEGKLAERLQNRLERLALLEKKEPQRWQMEVALLAERYEVREELDRLEMHLLHFRSCLEKGPFPVGRRLDFLLQEMMRESNTLMNKCQDFKVSQLGVDLKVAIERLKEQVQNIE